MSLLKIRKYKYSTKYELFGKYKFIVWDTTLFDRFNLPTYTVEMHNQATKEVLAIVESVVNRIEINYAKSR